MSSFLQTNEWGQFKQKWGWQPHRVDDVLVLSRTLFAGKSLWYAPETDVTDTVKIQALLEVVKKEAIANNALAFRLEIGIPWSDEVADQLRKAGFQKSFESVQPEWKAVVDIRPSDEQILSAMHQKGRYNIRVAERSEVTVEQTNNVDAFHALYTETAKRDRFAARGKEYFQDLLAMIPGTTIFLAKTGDTPLAAGLVIFYGETATYLYGASSSQERQRMAPYLLHWQAMQEAKRRGYFWYDLGEIPPQTDSSHPLQGLADFKFKFGAHPIHLLGSWDYILQPAWYTVFRVGEKLRRGFRA